MACLALPAMAADYTDMLSVTLDGTPTTPTQNTISVDENGDGTYTLSLKNFILYMESVPMYVGNILLENVEATANEGMTTLKTSQNIAITAGDDDTKTWMGPIICEGGTKIPVNMVGELRDSKFYTVISINFMGMEIKVVFGENGTYQITNSDFEKFHKATYDKYSSDEPNAWHSFMSSTGSLASVVSGTPHTFISDEVRPGTLGTKSVKLTSGIVDFFVKIPANGTLTTGRLQAGSATATNTKNNSFLDMSKTDKDGNGDPFYTTLSGQPDSIKLWVKFKQGAIADKNKDYKYATVSAIITDGTYYQDPEDKTYTNIVAKAKNDKIESNGFAWQEITVPFDYASFATNNASTKAILVTLSTNAQPGVASTDANTPDELYIDDLSLVYNSHLSSLKVKGSDVSGFDKDTKEYNIEDEGTIDAADIEAVADGQGAYVTKTVENVDGGVKATVTVTSDDLKSSNVYTLNIKGVTTGVNNVETSTGNGTTTIYNTNGQRVNSMSQKGLYIVRQADGKTVKVMKR